MPLPKDQAWFPAKKYGWGWGMPVRWQGWVLMVVFIIALFLGAFLLVPWHPLAYVGYLLGIGAILVAICYAKGEAPRWRWGDDESP